LLHSTHTHTHTHIRQRYLLTDNNRQAQRSARQRPSSTSRRRLTDSPALMTQRHATAAAVAAPADKIMPGRLISIPYSHHIHNVHRQTTDATPICYAVRLLPSITQSRPFYVFVRIITPEKKLCMYLNEISQVDRQCMGY